MISKKYDHGDARKVYAHHNHDSSQNQVSPKQDVFSVKGHMRQFDINVKQLVY